MTPIFAYYADLSCRRGRPEYEFFESLIAPLCEWVQTEIGGGFQVKVGGSDVSPGDGHTVSASRERVDSRHESFLLRWTHPGASGRIQYQDRVELVRVPQGVQLALTQTGRTLLSGMAPLNIVPYLPPVLNALAGEAEAFVLGERVPTAARKLNEKATAAFTEEILVAADRVLPAIVLSPHQETGKPIVEAARLHDAVSGLAHVVDLLTRQCTFEITNRLGKEWSCFNGAVRIYWPGAAGPGDEWRRHPIYFPDHYPPGSETALCEDIFRRIASAALVKFNDPPKLRIFRQAAERKNLEERNARIVTLTAGAEQARELAVLLERMQKERVDQANELEFARLQIAELGERLAAQKEQWAPFERELAGLKEAAERERRSADDFRRRFIDKIANVAEAVEYARQDFGDVLEFLPKAVQSAADSPYEHAPEVYKLFRALAEIMRKMRVTGSLGAGLYEEMKKYGFEYKDKISTTSATKFERHYTFQYGGKDRLFESHVTRGSGPPRSCISIHWLRDDLRKIFAVGWCGKHLTNTMS